MSQSALLERVIDVLEHAGIDYMVTGSLASSLQGEPRSTHDIDLVIQITEREISNLIASFPPTKYYLSESAARESLDVGGMFNLLDTADDGKVDFWVLTDEPFDQSRFSRKYVEEIFGMRLKVSRPEDTILQKLKWSVMAVGSEKAFTDALRVYEVQRDILDLGYIEQWADRIGVRAQWDRLKTDAVAI